MSTTTNVPAHIAARIAERQKSGKKSALASAIVSDGGGNSPPRISMRAGRFRLVEAGVETTIGTSLDVVIVGVNPKVSKVFYASNYDGGSENNRPSCFSNNGVSPDESVESPVSDSCATCAHNVLGSKITPSGAKSKMCADQRHLAVVPAADPQKVYSLTVPVSGMRGLREYFTELANYNINPEEAITELGFDENASYPKLVFSHKGYVPEKAIEVVENWLESDNTKVATREKPLSALVGLPPTQPELKIEPPKQTVDDDEADAYEEEAPVVAKNTKEKPTVTPVKASDELASKLDSLFDE